MWSKKKSFSYKGMKLLCCLWRPRKQGSEQYKKEANAQDHSCFTGRLMTDRSAIIHDTPG
jgi:hypothetical protein